ncbi:hypothetical protein H9P43_006205 [Blastocladiella emersonii ATCC 22665]|nr:hypothetical protein H9P43_006205 [Blastocladiella emersonii ATCC 22665]
MAFESPLQKPTSPTTATAAGYSLTVPAEPEPRASTSSAWMVPIPELPASQRVDIAFDELRYDIMIGSGSKATKRTILHGIASTFKAGRLTVIVGASGAGKTSCLNAVAGEATSGTISGNVYLNGQRAAGGEIKRVSGFVHQDDVLMGTQTVLEAITMSAQLRLPSGMSDAERQQRIDETITMLGLDKCKHSIVGTATAKGISGGERKRVCMARELVSNPPVFFLDEPSSGQDSYTAWSVVRLLKKLAESGRTVVATLHQPSSEIFHLVDDLCILSQGEVMYYGPAEESVPYFARAGYPCPQYSNPADFFFMDILNTEGSGRGTGEVTGPYAPKERIPRLLEVWKHSPENKAVLEAIARPARADGIKRDAHKYVAGFVSQFSVLMARAGRNVVRHPLIVKAKIAQSVVIGLLVGALFFDIKDRKLLSQIQDRTGVLFFLAIQQVISSGMGVVAVFSSEKEVFRREYGAGYYGLPAFFFSKMAVELPFQLITPAILVAISYYMVGLQHDAGKYVIATLVTVAMSLCGTAIGTMTAAAVDDLHISLVLVPLILMPMILGSDFLASEMPKALAWIKWLSPMAYGFRAFIKNEFTGLVMCPSESKDTDARVRARGCVRGEDTITALGFDDKGSILANTLAPFAIYLGFTALAYFALLRLVRSNKHVGIDAPARPETPRAIDGEDVVLAVLSSGENETVTAADHFLMVTPATIPRAADAGEEVVVASEAAAATPADEHPPSLAGPETTVDLSPALLEVKTQQ